jgi:hypothetical protein
MGEQKITIFSTSSILRESRTTLSHGEGPDHIAAERSTINAISRRSIQALHTNDSLGITEIGLSSCRSLSVKSRKSKGLPYYRNKNMGHSRGGKVEDIHEDDP